MSEDILMIMTEGEETDTLLNIYNVQDRPYNTELIHSKCQEFRGGGNLRKDILYMSVSFFPH